MHIQSNYPTLKGKKPLAQLLLRHKPKTNSNPFTFQNPP